MEMHEKGLPVLGKFVASGQPALCTNHDIQQLVDDFEEQTGQIQTSKDAAKIMTNLQTMKLQQHYNVDIVQKQTYQSTIWNYFVLMASQEKMSIVQSSIIKSSICVASENSWHAAIILLLWLAHHTYCSTTSGILTF